MHTFRVLTFDPGETYEPGECETASTYFLPDIDTLPPDAQQRILTALALGETVTLRLTPNT